MRKSYINSVLDLESLENSEINKVQFLIEAARTVLAIMIAPITGAPTFACRLIPVYCLKHDLILEKTQKSSTLIYQKGGHTFLLMTDNLRATQACFNLSKEMFGSTAAWKLSKYGVISGPHLDTFYVVYRYLLL